jgi:hypothetical protein
MKLYVPTMEVTVTDVDGDGRVHIEHDGWSVPTLQERRAIIYAAQNEIAEITEAIDALQKGGSAGPPA